MVKPLWFCFSSFSSQLYLSYCLESLAGDFEFQQLLPGGRSWTGGLSFGRANPSSKQEQGLLSQLQLQLQHCVRKASQFLKTMKKRQRHLLYHQGTHTSPPTGCRHHHHLFDIGKKAFLSLTTTTPGTMSPPHGSPQHPIPPWRTPSPPPPSRLSPPPTPMTPSPQTWLMQDGRNGEAMLFLLFTCKDQRKKRLSLPFEHFFWRNYTVTWIFL